MNAIIITLIIVVGLCYITTIKNKSNNDSQNNDENYSPNLARIKSRK